MRHVGVRHNHLTRDIKPRGQCPSCDEYHATQDPPCKWCGHPEAKHRGHECKGGDRRTECLCAVFEPREKQRAG